MIGINGSIHHFAIPINLTVEINFIFYDASKYKGVVGEGTTPYQFIYKINFYFTSNRRVLSPDNTDNQTFTKHVYLLSHPVHLVLWGDNTLRLQQFQKCLTIPLKLHFTDTMNR